MPMTRSDPPAGLALLACLICGVSACAAPDSAIEPARVADPSPVVAPAPETPAAPVPAEPDPLALVRAPPEGFVDLREAVPGACFSIRYHTADNFIGAPLPGYGAPGAWMLETPAAALAKVQADLQEQGYAVLVYDAYRPLRGTLAMVAWAKRTDQVHLLDDGYIARRSGHNHGHTIDLTVADAKTCAPLDMGTAWDTLNEGSHTRNAEGQALENRLLLKGVMKAHGFAPYSKEWWHFQYAMDGTRGRDVPYGCQEPEEGLWGAPAGWDAPGWAPPAEPPPGPCAGLTSPAAGPSASP